MVNVDLRSVALCTWVAAFAHVLVLVQGVESWTVGSVVQVASCLFGALPAIWGASVLLFAPGDANAALDVLLGRTHAASPTPARGKERPADASPEASSHRPGLPTPVQLNQSGDPGRLEDDSEEAAVARALDGVASARRISDDLPGTPTHTPPASQDLEPASPVYAQSSLFTQHVSPTSSRKSSRELPGVERVLTRDALERQHDDGTTRVERKSGNTQSGRDSITRLSSGRSGSFQSNPRSSENAAGRLSRGMSMDVRRSDMSWDARNVVNSQRRRLSLDTVRACDVFGSSSEDDDGEGTEEGWQDAITGIRGMAQALCDANNSVATVSLNADLTVSLSNLMLNTLKLFDPTGEKGGAAGTDARVSHLEDAHAIVKRVCTLAEPLFDTGCPLVLYNRFTPGELSFVPRDTFECCLFALVYRAGTRALDGDCVMTTDKISVDEHAKGQDIGGADATYGSAQDTSSRDFTKGRPSLDSVASAARNQGGQKKANALRVVVEYRTASRLMSNQIGHGINATELRFWKRRLKRIGGALKFEQVNVGIIGAHTERIIMTVPTAGSNTFLSEGDDKDPIAGAQFADSPKNQSMRSSRQSSARQGMSLRSPGGSHRGGLGMPWGCPGEMGGSGPGSRQSLDLREGSPAPSLGDQTIETLSNTDELIQGELMDVFDDDDDVAGPRGSARRLKNPLHSLVEGSDRDSGSSLDFLDDLYMLTGGQLDFKVLYIEDERVQAYFFINKCRRVFGDRCVVVHETDGIAALERLKGGEQYTVIVSDVFMSGMDGVSFFHTLFSTNLNTGNLVPEGLSDRELRMNIILTGADGVDLGGDLEQLQQLYGVLVYNKTSSVDVVGDVIKPHISFVESRLRDAIYPDGGGGRRSSQSSQSISSRSQSAVDLLASAGLGGEFLRARRSGRASGRSQDDSFSLASLGGDSFSRDISPLHAQRYSSSSLGANVSGRSFSGRSFQSETSTGRLRHPTGATGMADRDPVDHGDHWEGAGTAYNLISRSNTSLGTKEKPFPDTTNIRRAFGAE